jgi:hypothetical protein
MEPRSDVQSDWTTKALVKTAYKLGQIRIGLITPARTDQITKYYGFFYENATSNGQSKLKSVREYGADDSSLPPHEFNWTDGVAGTFSSAVFRDVPDAPVGPAFGDINGDGLNDFALSDGVYVRIYLSNGDGAFASAPRLLVNRGTGQAVVSIADVNGDGFSDLGFLFYEENSYTFYVYKSNGDGTIDNGNLIISRSGLISPFDIKFGDINGDGFADILENYNNNIYTHRSLGAGELYFDTTLSFSGPANLMNINDINGDGQQDILYFGIPNFPQGGFVIQMSL